MIQEAESQHACTAEAMVSVKAKEVPHTQRLKCGAYTGIYVNWRVSKVSSAGIDMFKMYVVLSAPTDKTVESVVPGKFLEV
jgi:hypothetical protein